MSRQQKVARTTTIVKARTVKYAYGSVFSGERGLEMQMAKGVSRQVKIAAIAFGALLAVAVGVFAIAPESAHASDMKNVIVLKSMKVVAPRTDYTEVDTFAFTYNSNGLLKKIKGVDEAGCYRHHFKETFTYKKLGLKKQVTKYTSTLDGPDKEGRDDTDKASKSTYVTRYKTDAKGRVTSSGEGNDWHYDSKGRLDKISWKAYGEPAYCTYKYNSKGLLAHAEFYDASYGDDVFEFKYDKHGQITLIAGNLKKKSTYSHTYKNSYKSGRLVKCVKKWYGSKSVNEKWTYQYQKIKVPKKAVKMIKEQQRQLLHRWDDAMLNMYGFWDGLASAHA